MMLHHNQRSMMSQQFAAKINDLKEMEKAEEGAAPKVKKNEVISNLYLQDLYRFYKLFHKRADFVNIFDENLNIYDNPLFKSVFEDQKILELVAELYFKFKYYNEALSVYDLLIKLWGDNYAFLQKKGYCLQESGQINEALENYLRSDILKPDSPWTVRRIATCYRALKKHKDAIEYFRKYLKLKPDNLQVELNIGNCYLELKDYENALTYYFKVDYLDSNNQKAWRPIAWCSFVLKKYDQADRYYEKILSNNPGIIDLINAGHNKWASGNIKDAINLYKKGAEEFANGSKEFEKIFHQDKDELIMAGIDETDIYLMADQILYNKR